MIPRVSVLMPVYNSLAFLGPAAASVLNQSLSDLELIIVDDASTDGSWALLESLAASDPRIVLMRNEKNLKQPGSINRALEAARGVYIARHDSDDVSLPQRLLMQASFLDAHSDHVLVGCQIGIIDEEGRALPSSSPYPLSDAGIRGLMLTHIAFCGPGVMIRRAALENPGLRFDAAMAHSEDYDLYSRLQQRGLAANLPQVLMLYRKRLGSVSILHADAQERAADEIAWRNLTSSGLAPEMSRDDLTLLRAWNHRARQLTMPERRRQLDLLRDLLIRLAARPEIPPHDMRLIRRKLAAKLRHGLPAWPRDAAGLGLAAQVLRLDPLGAASEKAAALMLKARRLLGRS